MKSEINPRLVDQIRGRLAGVQDAIDQAACSCGRDPNGIRLVVVSKAQPLEVVQAAVLAGIRIFGENYAEQAEPKITAMAGTPDIEWHMIGHIQGRKAGIVSRCFNMVQSLDSVSLAARLDRLCASEGRVMPVLLELNLAGEKSKGGWRVSSEAELDGIREDIEQVAAMPNLQIHGLMTMPPLFDDPEATRPYFSNLRRLAQALSRRYPNLDWSELSMGTSADYPAAVQEGATLVRIGQAVLGPRPSRTAN